MLRNAYLNYYYYSAPQSNRLTFHRLQGFLDLIERNFTDYTMQLLPATTILECRGTTIRNTVFNRQKFVYKEGLNAGSEFRVQMPVSSVNSITPIKVISKINDHTGDVITPVVIIGTYNPGINSNINSYKISAQIIVGLSARITGVGTVAEIHPPASVSIPWYQYAY